jgi:fatty acid kinase fatty acid binding subunit
VQVPGVAVVTDSTSSLSSEQAERAGIRVIPLQVVVDDVSRAEGEISPADVAAALRSGRRVSTSRPTPEAFATTFAELAAAGHPAVVAVHLSSGISGTAAAAQLAAALSPVPVTVVDSHVVAMATGFAALAGAAAAAAGAGPEDVAAVVARRAAASTTYFCVDSLEHLRRGGRMGAAAALLGSALAVKPLLTVSDGAIRSAERVRTASRARARLAELALGAVAGATARGDEVEVAVHHLDNPDGAAALLALLVDDAAVRGPVVVAELSAVLGVHVGPGTLGVVVSPTG